jgi:pimeloyl-ACP methyl ester carboxylesterase
MPTLLVWGDQDAFVPPSYAAHWAELLAGAQPDIVTVEGAGHMVPYERSDLLAEAIGSFLGAPAPAVGVRVQ